MTNYSFCWWCHEQLQCEMLQFEGNYPVIFTCNNHNYKIEYIGYLSDFNHVFIERARITFPDGNIISSYFHHCGNSYFYIKSKPLKSFCYKMSSFQFLAQPIEKSAKIFQLMIFS